MASDLAPLVDRIRVLVHEPASDPSNGLVALMEHTLTDGYAHALALEAEGMRVKRELDAAVIRVGQGARADELGALADRIAKIQGDLSRLRKDLDALRRRADVVRRSVRAA